MKTPAVKIPQPHGGALNAGGTPGNSGGKPGRSGRPRSALRERAFGSFEERLAVLEKIADNDDAQDSDRIRAVDTIGKCVFRPKLNPRFG